MEILNSWVSEFTDVDSLRILVGFALRHAERASEPLLIEVLSSAQRKLGSGAFPREELKRLVHWEVAYSDGDSPSRLVQLRQALAFFQKLEFLDIGIDKELVAFEKFVQSERLCRETNELFTLWSKGQLTFPRGVDSVFHGAAKIIARVLGPVPQLSELRYRFGPGATTATKRRVASVRRKLSADITCSENLLPAASAVLEQMPGWLTRYTGSEDWASVPVTVTAGILSFVPKSAKTFRSVVTEPVLNGLGQLALGDLVAERLRRFGVDTRDQTLNQRLAREGSLTGALATLDLSSASDTISRELVFHLLPVDWASLLWRFTTRVVDYRGCPIRLEKFSSMGNGFTFALETLIFWALAKAAAPAGSTVTAYGDDLIIPAASMPWISTVLRVAGFLVNSEKSYAQGPFRESCGKDYYRGIDIRPFYQKSLVSGVTLFTLHNFYKRNYDEEMVQEVLKYLPEPIRIYGPEGYGDGHLLGEWRPRPYRRELGYSGFIFDTYTLRSVVDRKTLGLLPGDGVLPLYQAYIAERRKPFDPLREVPVVSRGLVFPGHRGYRRVSIYTLTSA